MKAYDFQLEKNGKRLLSVSPLQTPGAFQSLAISIPRFGDLCRFVESLSVQPGLLHQVMPSSTPVSSNPHIVFFALLGFTTPYRRLFLYRTNPLPTSLRRGPPAFEILLVDRIPIPEKLSELLKMTNPLHFKSSIKFVPLIPYSA